MSSTAISPSTWEISSLIQTRSSSSPKLATTTSSQREITMSLTANSLTTFLCSQLQASSASTRTQKSSTSLMQPSHSGPTSWICRLQMEPVQEESTGKKSSPKSLMTSKPRLYQSNSTSTTSGSHLIFPHQPRLCSYRSLRGTIISSTKCRPRS